MQRRKIRWIIQIPEESQHIETVEQQILSTKDEREDVQKKTFAKWINSQLLKNHHEPISDLFIDLRDGNRLLSLLEVLTSKTYKRERGRMRVHHLNNVNKALQILEQNNVKLVNISSNDIVDGNPKLTLGLVWSIILHWQVHYHLKDLMTELQQTNLEKTLLAWCRQNSQNYSGVDIKNFTTSWSDGLAFNAILHKWKSHLFDFNNIARKHPNARLDHAFRLAQEHLGIERLLDPEDVNTSVPDKKSIMMYVMCLFQSLPHSGDDIGELDLSIASDSTPVSPVTTPGTESTLTFGNFGMPSSRPMSLATNVSVELGGYQVALEDVLTWLLEAEDKLNHAPEPGSTLDILKQQFHEHETFLMELSGHQDGVGTVLEEGARLLAEGGLHKDEEHEVRVQMSLLNSRWEGLRMRAMERQTRIHEVLMQMQQAQLDALRQWLTKTEDRISLMAAIELNPSTFEDQLKHLNELKQDIHAQQDVVDGMRNMVVVVDEENSEAVYTQMEDQLSALGERWSHIGQWKEERRQRLESLSALWQSITDDYKRLVAWLNETEITLKQMEANPASEFGEVLDRIKKLQILKAEMDINQKKLTSLQESIQDLDGNSSSSEYASILEKIENLQDRWEAVGQIMEVQSQRITNSGFEFDLMSEENVTTIKGNEWMSETVTSIAYKEEITATSTPYSDSKKRRVDNTTKHEFESALLHLYKWLDYVDLEIGRSEGVFDELSVEEKKVVYEDILADMDSHKNEYDKVLEIGKQLIDELKNANESIEEEESKIKDIQNCWVATNNRLQEIKRRIDYLEEVKKFRTELANLNLMLESYTKWFETNKENNQIELFRVKMKSMKSHDERIRKLVEKAKELSENQVAITETNSMDTDVKVFFVNWENLYTMLSERLTEITNAIDRTPPKRYIEAITNLMSFINNVEGFLLSEHIIMSGEKIMEEQIKRFKNIQNSLKEQEETFKYVNSAGQDLIAKINDDSLVQRLKDELQDLNTKWSDIPIILEEKQQTLIKDITILQTFNTELFTLESWLEKSSLYLENLSKDNITDNVETTEHKLQQIHSFSQEIDKTKPQIEALRLSANDILEKSEVNFTSLLNNKLEAITYKWNTIVNETKSLNDKYESALKKNDNIINGIEDFTKWLSSLEKEIPVESRITSSVELFQVRGRYQALKDNIDKRVEEFRNLNEMGNDKLLSSEGSSVQELGRRFTFLNARWTDVTDRIYERYRHLQNASHEYGEFRALVAQESDWLDKLDKRLKKSPKAAADAEEISEELDDLENYIRNHPESRLEKIQEIGKQLIDSNIMTHSIETDVEGLTNRWENLNKQAGQRAKLLEGSVKQAQQSEGRILALQHSLTQIDSVLTARLDCDLTADDLPHDYQKLMEELEQQHATLEEMASQIESYKASGKQEAALRLQEQMSLIEQKYAKVQRKFQRFRCPTNIEPRLSRALRELRGIEEATCLLELSSEDPEVIEGQLKHCLRFYQTLSEIKSEIECIIVTGRKLVEDKAIPEPDKFSKRIDMLKELYNKLGLHITEFKSILESALDLSRDMHKSMAYINMSVESINKELDTQKSLPDLPVNAIYVQETLTEVIPRLNVIRDKLFVSQNQFSKLCDSMYLEQLKEKMSDVIIRLANTEKRLRVCQGSEDEPNVDEINAWLLQVEEKLNKLDAVSMDQLTEHHFEQCKAVQSEMIEAKPKVNQLQRYAFHPQVAEVCEKWEVISNRIQEWIHKITDNLLIKSKAEASKGRDNYGRNKLSKQLEQISTHPAKKEKKLIDENKAIYGIGYFNPAFDDNQCAAITPESSPTDVPHRSRKSSAKSEKITTRIVDVSRTVRRKLDMSTVPDVVQTSQPQVVQVDDDLPSPCSDTDVHMTDEEEFFLAKNSKLFSQVSSNTLTATDMKTFNTACVQQNPFRIVEVKEMEIVKSVASPEDHVILPSANVSVGLVPQVVERVEIIEDTETEAESIDTDTEDKEVKGKIPSTTATTEQIVKKKELVPILKKKAPVEPSPRNIKRFILKLSDQENLTDSNKNTSSDVLLRNEEVDAAGFSKVECIQVDQQLKERSNKSPRITSSWKDTESVAEYLILDDEEIERNEKSDIKTGKQAKYAIAQISMETQENGNNQKETSKKSTEYSIIRENTDNASRSEEENLYKKSPLLKHMKNLSKDDTLEDCESFYGSDKETDDALIFSDDTEIDVGSSSSDGEDTNLGEHVEHLLDKMKVERSRPIMQHKMETKVIHEKALFKNPMGISRTTLEKNILEFEQLAQMMLCRMDVMLMSISGISNEKDPTKRLEILKSEISTLAPDAAALISKGDGLVMTIHMNDPARAEKIKHEHQDKLRSKWHQVMAEIETRRKQAQKAEEVLRQYNNIITEFEEWFRDVPLKLEQANNYEGQLESFTEEFDTKQIQIHKLNELAVELKKLNVGYSESVRYNINSNWQKVSSQFKRFSGSKDKDKHVTEKKVELDTVGVNPQEFIARINKLREAIVTVSRSLNSLPLNGRDYELFINQEECLKKINNALNILKPSVDEVNYVCESVTRQAKKEQSDQIKRLSEKLQDEWASVSQSYMERYNRWIKCYEKWRELHNTCRTFAEWLDKMEDALKKCNVFSHSKTNKTKTFELEQEVSRMQRTLNNINIASTDISSRASTEDVIELQNIIENIKHRWHNLVTEINARKEKNFAMERKVNNEGRILETAYNIIEQVNTLLVSAANPSDETSLSIRLSLIKAREEELTSRKRTLQTLINQSNVSKEEDESNKLLANMDKANTNLSNHREYVECKLASLRKYICTLDAVMTWVMETRTRLSISQDLSQHERNEVIKNIMSKVEDREMEVKDVLENYTNLEKECESAKQPVSVELQEKLKKLREDWQFVKCYGENEASSTISVGTTSKEVERSVGTAAPGAAGAAGAAAGGSRGLSASPAPSLPSTPVATSSPSASVSSASSSPSPSTSASALVAGLDKSVLQIRDWLTVEEEMLRQQSVVVGDVDEIMHLLDKQKNVLRELEQKKPQLDELVHTAENLRADTNRQQLHGKVTKLREHWDETNSKVMQRKTQLDMMLGDSQRYEAKRNEVEVWLARMETRLERMRAVGHTADVLEAQLREQKSFHAELHQYKHHIELFNQLTQKLIAVYQQDDTTRVKKMTETINQRYNNLNTSIINRGKLLHSAMNSLHNFDRSLDKFLAWLSEAESSMEGLEAEADRLGGRRDQGALRRPQHQLKVRLSRSHKFHDKFRHGIFW
ncbi:PREDICTED: dystrophin, isoforms A/C/F/G/H-like [Atta cephalotes]|uniref:Calponin-homology (CH) domain-containing protein n=1 Tax=Atta cephalotes TaxID=12957 RepID=A0A158NE49_ATTCE|nr:PREDICTED: dystrophin, isoforms A/C/F/G/H-like [Atta cephalotes]